MSRLSRRRHQAGKGFRLRWEKDWSLGATVRDVSFRLLISVHAFHWILNRRRGRTGVFIIVDVFLGPALIVLEAGVIVLSFSS